MACSARPFDTNTDKHGTIIVMTSQAEFSTMIEGRSSSPSTGDCSKHGCKRTFFLVEEHHWEHREVEDDQKHLHHSW